MHFEAKFTQDQVVKILPRFFALVGIKPWRRRWDTLDHRCREAPTLERTLAHQYRLEYALRSLWKRKAPHRSRPKTFSDVSGEAMQLVCNVYAVYSRLNKQGKKNLKGKIASALKDDRGFVPLAFELTTAIYLMGQGVDVEFTDLEGKQKFDLKITSRDGTVAEVECKTASFDKGRKIHRRHFESFVAELSDDLMSTLERPRGWDLLTVELKDRFPSNRKEQTAIVEAVRRTIAAGEKTRFGDGGVVQASMKNLSPRFSELDLHHIAFRQVGDDYHCCFWGDPNGRRLMGLVMYSKTPDRHIESIRDELGKASRQLTGERPGLLFVRLAEIKPYQWHFLKQAASDIAVMARGLFEAEHRRHLHSIAFSSTGVPGMIPGVGFTAESKWVVFKNHKSLYSSHPVLNELASEVTG